MARRINYPFILLTFIMRMPQRPILWSGIKLLLKRACAPPRGSIGYSTVNAKFNTTNQMIETDAANSLGMAPPV